MDLTDPADPGGDSGAVEIGGPLTAAPADTAHPGSAQGEPRAPQEAAGEREPAAGQSQDGDDDEDLPARVTAPGATADPV